MSSAVGIIPARMASSRFPGKPLAPLLGIPMIQHVYQRSMLAQALEAVYVATCDRAIADVVAGFGGRAVMTASTHERCTDRVAEAVERLGLRPDIIVNIQGDEPMVTPEHLDRLVEAMRADAGILAANVVVPIRDEREHRSPNIVKVVSDLQGCALYYSREAIPSRWKGEPRAPLFRQTGIIGFTRALLQTFRALAPTPLEAVESVDMLRVLEHGHRVKLIVSDTDMYTVDTEEDRRCVEERMRHAPSPARDDEPRCASRTVAR